MHTQDAEMRRLRATWGGGWYIWRGHRSDDANGGIRDGDWIGTKVDESAGVHATVMADSAGDLDRELAVQAAMAQAVAALVEAVRARGVMRAEPDGDRVLVTHCATGRCESVAVGHDEVTEGLSWAWLLGDGSEPIGDVADLANVVRKIQDRLGKPFRRS